MGVEAAMTMGQVDADMEKSHRRQMIMEMGPDIRMAFKKMDEDGSGILDKMEVAAAAVNLPELLQDKIKPKEVLAFFDTLDVDGSGELEEDEFVEGVLNYMMSDVPIQTQQMLKLLRLIWTRIDTELPASRGARNAVSGTDGAS